MSTFQNGTQLAESLPMATQVSFSTPQPPQAPIPPAMGKQKWELRTLSPRHHIMLRAKAQGLPREDVARLAKCTKEYVSMLLAQPIAQQELERLMKEQAEDYRHLSGMAVDTVRRTLRSADDRTALAAAKLVLDSAGHTSAQSAHSAVSAEDVVAQLLAASRGTPQVAVQINNYPPTHKSPE